MPQSVLVLLQTYPLPWQVNTVPPKLEDAALVGGGGRIMGWINVTSGHVEHIFGAARWRAWFGLGPPSLPENWQCLSAK